MLSCCVPNITYIERWRLKMFGFVEHVSLTEPLGRLEDSRSWYKSYMLAFCSCVLFHWASATTLPAFWPLLTSRTFSPFTNLFIFDLLSILSFWALLFFLSLPSLSSFSVAFFHLSGMLPSPFSQGCYGDVIFFYIYIYILGASSNVFFRPLLVFLLSFVSDWLLFYAEDAAIVLPRRAEAVCIYWFCLSLKEPMGGCGWAEDRQVSFWSFLWCRLNTLITSTLYSPSSHFSPFLCLAPI